MIRAEFETMTEASSGTRCLVACEQTKLLSEKSIIPFFASLATSTPTAKHENIINFLSA